MEGKSLGLPKGAPYPIDGLRRPKALIGFVLDRVVGAIWLIVATLGGGKDKVGIVVALALLGAAVYWHLR
jgi:hypothetical protein